MKVIVLGSTGMLGHMVVDVLRQAEDVEVVPCSRRELDLLQPDVEKLLDSRPDCVVNCAGIIRQKAACVPASEMISVNSLFPHLLAEACERRHVRLMQISTDCVFSGRKGMYTVEDLPDPDDLYGRSKLMGELDPPHVTIRTSIIGPELSFTKFGLMEWFLKSHGAVNGYDNAYWNGVTTLELARLIRALLRMTGVKGLVQLSSPDHVSKYELLCMLKAVFDVPTDVRPMSLRDPVDRTIVKSAIGLRIPTLSQQLMELKKWMNGDR